MRRSMRVPAIAALAVLLVGVLAGSADAATARTIVVWPGQSIQAAVNRANPGDTVLLKPGTYRQSVLINRDGVRLRGSGAGVGGTIIEAGGAGAKLCAKNATGICVLGTTSHPVAGTFIDDLLVRNFEANGVFALNATGLVVQNVIARNNGEYGIARFATSGGALINNVATGSGEAGLYIGDSPRAMVFVAGNDVSGNALGILQRHAQHSLIQYNDIHDNCIGILFVAAPAPVGSGVFSYNSVHDNNKLCKGNPEEIPFDYSGSGIAMVGTTGEVIANNAVFGNRGNTPLSGGIVLLNGAPFHAPPTSGNTVQYNTAYHNSPADIVDHSGGTNTFKWNRCDTPAPLCH